MIQTSYQRVIDAVRREGDSVVFINRDGGVSVSKTAKSMFEKLVEKGLKHKIIGYYNDKAEDWMVEEDLVFMKVMDK